MTETRPRLAMITGGAEGIGQTYAARLAEDGHDIIVVDRLDASQTRALVEAHGRPCETITCDLRDRGAIENMVADISARHGGCDILINNAAIGSQRGFDAISHAMVREMLAINLEAPFLLIKGLLPAMRSRGWGRIVNITSGTLNSALGGFVDYLMTKGALLGLTRSLASEIGRDGITINALSPGLVRTPMTTGGRDGHATLPDIVFDTVKMLQSIKRETTREDLAAAMSFLVSDDAAMMTGQVLYCDGGTTRV